VSSLWTPEGEHRVDRNADAPTVAGDDGHLEVPVEDDWQAEDDEELAARLAELRHQLLSTPAEVVVANHAYGMFELAALHLSEQPPRLDEARLAVDALGALVGGLAGRLGDAEASLNDALAQIRLAYVQIGGAPSAPPGDGSTPPPS
jgi:hypothetical protein